MDRVDLELGLELVEIQPSHARWQDAVILKENRAYTKASQDSGLSLEEVRRLYHTHPSSKDVSLHDAQLRLDAKQGGVLLFLRDNLPLAYAIAKAAAPVEGGAKTGNISDVCFAGELTDLDHEAVFQALLSWAAAHGAEMVFITAGGKQAELLEGIGGELVTATWQFPPSESAPLR